MHELEEASGRETEDAPENRGTFLSGILVTLGQELGSGAVTRALKRNDKRKI
jgi:hypothetical protein